MLTSFWPGLVIGFIPALTGAGGGILAVPASVFGAHQSVAQAGPVGLLAAGMALSPLGLWLVQRIESRWLTLVFAMALLFVAYRTHRQANTPASSYRDAAKEAPQCITDKEPLQPVLMKLLIRRPET